MAETVTETGLREVMAAWAKYREAASRHGSVAAMGGAACPLCGEIVRFGDVAEGAESFCRCGAMAVGVAGGSPVVFKGEAVLVLGPVASPLFAVGDDFHLAKANAREVAFAVREASEAMVSARDGLPCGEEASAECVARALERRLWLEELTVSTALDLGDGLVADVAVSAQDGPVAAFLFGRPDVGEAEECRGLAPTLRSLVWLQGDVRLAVVWTVEGDGWRQETYIDREDVSIPALEMEIPLHALLGTDRP